MLKQQLSFSSDSECLEQRKYWISKGFIKEGDKSSALREVLIRKGIIDPKVIELAEPSPRRRHKEEGKYSVRPIRNRRQYETRLNNYFYCLQSILKSRAELKLDLGSKRSDDPDWFF